MSANNTFHMPPNFTIKPIQLFDHEFSSVVANDKVEQLNQDKMVAVAKEDKVNIYNTMADPILDSGLLTTNDFDYQTILSSVSTTVSIFTLVISNNIISHIHKVLAVAHALASNAKSIFSYSPSVHIHCAPTTPFPPSIIQQIHNTLP